MSAEARGESAKARRGPAEGHREPAEGHREPAEGHREPAEGHREPAEGHREIDTSNHQKYADAAKNPVMRALLGQLFARVGAGLDCLGPSGLGPQSLLDAGCGEGHLFDALGSRIPADYVGVDANPACVDWCRQQEPTRRFEQQSVYALDFADRRFDAVVCMEVLEHLERPEAALAELCRVCTGGLVLTVPFEPVFQLGNLLRGKYRSGLGNHPEHIQHWGRRSFPRFLEGTRRVDVERVDIAGAWLVAVVRPR